LIPEHTSTESLYACELARNEGDEDCLHEYRELHVKATGKPPSDHDVRGVSPDDFSQLLALDPTSPYYLCAAGDIHLANGEFDSAEQKYRQSLAQLPEYVAAHFGLGVLLRRERRIAEATIHLRMSLIGPIAFYGGSFWSDSSLPGSFRIDWSRKAIMWLQQSKSVHESLADDPFVRRIDALKFETGLAENPDMNVLQLIVEEYAAAGSYSEAARIWQLIGERAAMETTSFRERYKLNPTIYGSRLGELLTLSGNDLRATLVRTMLASMKSPLGLYL
jgi:tetratricopeptide (TPR) repeat protein